MDFKKIYRRGLGVSFLLLMFVIGVLFIPNLNKVELTDENSLSLNASEDLYEPNNHYTDAFDLTSYYNIWLSSIYGLGAQYDDDWYQIYVAPEFGYLIIECSFINISGNIDMDLYHNSDPFNPIATSWTENDYEYIYYSLPLSGIYYIKIHGLNNTNNYDLRWIGDDMYEENDDWTMASDLSSNENNGHMGIQADEDWYQVWVIEKRFHVDVYYDQAEGDINFGIYQYDGIDLNQIAWTSDTCIDTEIPWNDWYYIKVYGENAGNIYDLRWEDYNPDDAYEHYEPYYLPEGRWLSSIDGKGIQWNDDWYEINVNPGETRLIVFLLFSHWEGDIDLEVRDISNVTLVSSTDVMDNEFIDFILPSSGTYYLRVYYGNTGNQYNLLWDGLNPSIYDDKYEENDNNPSISTSQATWMSSVPPNLGLGIQWDKDWYEVYLDPGENRLFVELIYRSTQGNIGIDVFDKSFKLIGGSNTPEDNEIIDMWLSPEETYYLLVYGDNTGNIYDLWWEDISPYSVYDDNYEFNNDMNEAYFLSDDEGKWLSEIAGKAVQGDEDWFKIAVTPGFRHLMVNLSLTYGFGNIRFSIHSEYGNYIGDSYSVSYGEYFNIDNINPGIYFIHIWGDNTGIEYDLWWDDLKTDLRPDDNYEINNNPSSAYDISYAHEKSLREIHGLGLQFDEDWYKIYITNPNLILIVMLAYDSAEGLMGFEVYDRNINKITGNFTLTDNDYITHEVSNGTYYIRVFGDNSGNVYNLWWGTREPEKTEMIPGYDLLILITSIISVSIIAFKLKRSKLKHK